MSAVLQPAAAVKPSSSLPQTSARNLAIDTYRGMVMFLMMAEVLEFARVSAAFPGNPFWSFLAWNQTHAAWSGCSLHDTIQPGFSFLVGVALPYSIAARLAKGGTFGRMLGHAMWRSLLLISLGIFLRSQHTPITYFTFEDTLSQIGLGYTFLFLLGFASRRVRWGALGAVLVGYWLAWALYPAPTWAAHWAKDANLGVAFDQWFLNLFPRTSPFVTNSGGYLTLSFIPTLGTMILGLIAGDWLRSAAPRIPFRKFFTAAAVCIAAGLVLHFTGICPIVKRIWTPSWTLFSGGLCFLYLSILCWLTEVKGYRRWAFPLVVIGANSIAAYVLAETLRGWIIGTLRIHLGPQFFAFLGAGLQPLIQGIAILALYWSVLLWMYRRKLFLKI
jgi:heparan-alpha-glucosaminide N-acetyltransferase